MRTLSSYSILRPNHFYKNMLVIRKAQMDVFQAHAEDDFVERLMKYLREEQDAETYELDDAELRRRVKIGIEKARSYDLTWEKPIVFFVQLMFDIAPNFDEQKNIRDVLEAPYEEPNEKMDDLLENTSDEDWEQASVLYDETVWQIESD